MINPDNLIIRIRIAFFIVFAVFTIWSSRVFAESFSDTAEGETLVWEASGLSNISLQNQRVDNLGTNWFEYTAVFPAIGDPITLSAEITPNNFFGSSYYQLIIAQGDPTTSLYQFLKEVYKDCTYASKNDPLCKDGMPVPDKTISASATATNVLSNENPSLPEPLLIQWHTHHFGIAVSIEPILPCLKIGKLNLCASSTMTSQKNTYTFKGPGVNINNILWFSGDVTFISHSEDDTSSGVLQSSGDVFVKLSSRNEVLFTGPVSFQVDGEAGTLVPSDAVGRYASMLAGLTLFPEKSKPITIDSDGVTIEPMIYVGTPSYALAKVAIKIKYHNNGNKELLSFELVNGRLTPSIQFMNVHLTYDPDTDVIEGGASVSFPFMGTWGGEVNLRWKEGCGFDGFDASVGFPASIPLGQPFIMLNGVTVKVENLCDPIRFAEFFGGDLALDEFPTELLVLSGMGMWYIAPYTFKIVGGSVKFLGFEAEKAGLGGDLWGTIDFTPGQEIARMRWMQKVSELFYGKIDLGINPRTKYIGGTAWGSLTIPEFSCSWYNVPCKAVKAIILYGTGSLPYKLSDMEMTVNAYRSASAALTVQMRGMAEIAGQQIACLLLYENKNFELMVGENYNDLTTLYSSANVLDSRTATQGHASVEKVATIKNGLNKVVFAATGQLQQPSLYLIDPSGVKITSETVKGSKNILYIEDNAEFVSLYIVEKPAAGTWAIGCDNLSESSVKFGILAPQPAPVAIFGTVQKTGNNVNIPLSISPASDNTTVELFFTSLPDNGTGFLIGEAQKATSGNVSFLWETSSVASGTYYLYAEVDDGKNPPVRTFYDKPITVSTGTLQPPTNLQGTQEGNTVTLTWTPSISPTVIGYYVLYTDTPEGLGYKFIVPALNADNATITDLDPNKTYKFCVVAFDESGNRSIESEPWETTSENGGHTLPCPVENLFSKDTDTIYMLQQFRDTILNTCVEGRILTGLYYRHSAELTQILTSDVSLRGEAVDTILQLLPSIKQALAARSFVLSHNERQIIKRLGSRILPKASASLKADILKTQKKLEQKNLLTVRRP